MAILTKRFADIDMVLTPIPFECDGFKPINDSEDVLAPELPSIMGFRLSRKATEITRQIAKAQTLFPSFLYFITMLAETHNV